MIFNALLFSMAAVMPMHLQYSEPAAVPPQPTVFAFVPDLTEPAADQPVPEQLAAVTPAAPAPLFQSNFLDPPKEHPGYVGLENIEDFTVDGLTLEINIGKGLLELASAFSPDSDPEVQETMKHLEHITVRGFNLPVADEEKYRAWLDGKLTSLRDRGWTAMASIRDGDDTVQVLMLAKAEKISGIFVVVQDDEEAVFVNIIGDIDVKSIATISRQFDIPGIDAIEQVMP